jgi:hypothetical protein
MGSPRGLKNKLSSRAIASISPSTIWMGAKNRKQPAMARSCQSYLFARLEGERRLLHFQLDLLSVPARLVATAVAKEVISDVQTSAQARNRKLTTKLQQGWP